MLKKLTNYFLARNFEAGEYLDNFFVSAVFSIVSIRLFLWLTGYPSLGGSVIHIAHLLWGGLLMLTGYIILLSFLSKEAKNFAAVLGGLGFGAFIDELGKFITRDNNYFFQPTIALLYLLFMAIFFLIRGMEDVSKPTDKEYVINALELTKEVVIYDLDEFEKKRALAYLEKSSLNTGFVDALKSLLKSSETVVNNNVYFVTKLRRFFSNYYYKLVRQKSFAFFVITFFIIATLVNLFFAAVDIKENLNFWSVGHIISALVSGFFVLYGVYFLVRNRRLNAFNLLKKSVTVTIFFTQFFLFYRAQLIAMGGLFINVSIYSTLQYLIYQEKSV